MLKENHQHRIQQGQKRKENNILSISEEGELLFTDLQRAATELYQKVNKQY